MNLIVYGLIALAILGALGGIYATGHHAGSTAKQAEWDEASRKQHAKEETQSAAAATNLETTRAEERVVFQTITKTVDRIVDRPVYRDRCFDADGLCLANAAILGKGADSCKPDQPMPGIKPAPQRDGRRTLTLDYELGRGVPRLLGQASSPG